MYEFLPHVKESQLKVNLQLPVLCIAVTAVNKAINIQSKDPPCITLIYERIIHQTSTFYQDVFLRATKSKHQNVNLTLTMLGFHKKVLF